MKIGCVYGALLLRLLLLATTGSVQSKRPIEEYLSNSQFDADVSGTRWAVLVAGSNGYYNYRHQVTIVWYIYSVERMQFWGRLRNQSKTYYFLSVCELFLWFLQADVCHAYEILKQGGLKDENIIVFMYDDIAYNKDNPTPGFIVNKPYGPNVYPGVPKVRLRQQTGCIATVSLCVRFSFMMMLKL